jgi:hypothetical protein
LTNEDVLGLDISMDEAVGVDKVNCDHDFVEHLKEEVFADTFERVDVVEEVSILGIFDQHFESILADLVVQKFDDEDVFQVLLRLDFSELVREIVDADLFENE